MTKEKIWTPFIAAVCILLTFSAFFADQLSLYDFHMEVMDYSYEETDGVPAGADTSVWFDYGTHGRNLFYGYTDEALYGQTEFFMRTAGGVRELSQEDMQEFPADSLGNLIAVLPVQSADVDGDGKAESIYDSARADFGANAFNPVPQRFDSDQIPFELIFAERNRIEVRFQNELLTDAELYITMQSAGKKK